jgi:predicted TIM-barrel fold metal-dependent hydrolase
VGYGSVESISAKDSRVLNDNAAELVHDHPTRFGLFATLPMLDVDASLAEIAHCLDTLKADGFGVATSYKEAWLGDPRFEPIWAELDRRGAVVFVHPFDAPCCTPNTLTYETPPVYGPWIEWPMNTARTILSLMVTGTLRRHPGVRFIFAHGGGVMPLLVERIAGFKDWAGVAPEGPDRLKTLFPGGIEAEFAGLYFECAQAFAPANLAALLSLAPASHVLFGTDYASFPMSHSVKAFRDAQLSSSLRRAIGRDNALKLFPRFRA